MITVHRVSNGVNRANFSKAAIEQMKMLGLIQSRGSSVVTNEGKQVRVFYYTPSFDNRVPAQKGKW